MLVKKVKYWHRYVDDVVCAWTGTDTELKDFLSLINSHYPSIQFTLEKGGSSINFLDLSITLKNGTHKFNIFRKPTYTDVVIDGSSFHPRCHKHAAFRSMIHRLVSIPLSPSDFQKELDTIIHVAKTNNVRLDIKKLVRKKSISHALDATSSLPREKKKENKKQKWIRLTHLASAASPQKYLVYLDPSTFAPHTTLQTPTEMFYRE